MKLQAVPKPDRGLGFYHVLVISIVLSSVFLFGATQDFVLSGEEALITFLFSVWFINRKERIELTPLFWPYIAFLSVSALQIVPLPVSLVGLISPETVVLKEKFGVVSAHGWTTLSLVPLATLKELIRWITVLMLYIMVVNLFRFRRQLYALINSILALSVFESAYGLFLLFTGSHALLWYSKPQYVTGRAHGTYRNPDHFAGYLDMVIPLHLSQVLQWRHEGIYKTEEKSKRLFGVFLVTFLCLSLCLSLSRAGIVSFILSIVFFIFATSKKEKKHGRLYIWALFLLLLSYLVWIGVEPILERFFKAAAEFEKTRMLAWKDTLTMIRRFPVLGTGLGSFPHVFSMFKTFPHQAFWDHAHNDYLEFAAELGIPGFLFFWWGIFKTVKMGFLSRSRLSKGAASGVVAMLIHSVFDFNLHIPANAYVLFVIMGIVWIVEGWAHGRYSHSHNSGSG